MMYYTDTNNHTLHTTFRRVVMMGVCALATLCTVPTMAQVVIGGDVYGGGKMGEVEDSDTSTPSTTVVINNGSVRTVFGGGQEGAVTGNTTVSVNGGTIGAKALEGTPYGGVYGGGEGAAAKVTGSTNVTIRGGDNFNNVYGGGKQALLTGNAHVTLIGGKVYNNVFAGACMANINGYALVDIKGGSANQLLVKAVYGGNDISGSINNNNNATPISLGYSYKVTNGLPTKLESFVFAQATATNALIGNVFGGGNGAYQYSGSEGNWSVTMKDLGTGTVTFANLPNKPIAPHAYLQIEGGTYGSIYGGGNEATISERTDIYFGIGMNGEDYADVTPIKNIPVAALSWLDLYEGYTMNEGGTTFNMQYNAYRIFGGNNIADMAIRPTWHLKSGMVGNIYSGGNQGRMTYEKGLFLPLTSNHIKVNNVYGGCRMADVNPGGANGNGTIAGETIIYHRFKHADGDKFAESYNATYEFTEGYAARVLVLAGKINNLYGGNDISGKVYYGTNVELRGAISGDVYGGGNGSYAYTDNADWIKKNPQDADYYYSIPVGGNSLDALYAKRPHVEKTLLHITGIDAAAPPVYVTGGVFCGGNSATLDKDGDQSSATAKFMIGQKVFINSVFLGSNGENMVSTDILRKYADNDFSSLDLKNESNFAEYMKGVSVNLVPKIVWEWDDSDDSNQPGQTNAGGINSFIGAFYCGGNVGSMTTPYQMNMTFPRCLTIYDRIVGGCNSANISQGDYNAALEGGVTSEFTNGTSKEDNKAKVVLNVRSRLEPGKLTVDKDSYGFLLGAGYKLNTKDVNLEGAADVLPVYVGANVYGGCYASGYINGDVEINIADDLISPIINKEILNRTADYVYASAMAIYGGGYGTGTEIRGNTKLNFSDKARVLLAFGGGQMGQVGKKVNDEIIGGNAVVNFDKGLELPGDAKDNFNVYRAYAGGYAGTIIGNTTLKLLGGGVMRAFAGACNAYINGYATAIVGCAENYGKGLPYVSNAVLGGNDFGGQIIGSNTWDIEEDVQNKSVTSQTYVQYLSGKIGRAIYGGSYGSYDYDNKTCYPENVDGKPVTRPVSAPTLSSTFVDIASQSTNANDIIGSDNSESILTLVAGGGRGYKGLPEYVKVDNTYVLLRGNKNRTTPLAHRVYGGGNLSSVGNTLVEAYSGNYSQIFGGTHGVLTETATDLDASYDNTTSTINVYASIDNDKMDIFGAGANSGTTESTTINLYGGKVKNVYGGSLAEGYTAKTVVNVPENSYNLQANALFGGALGESESRPCDVGASNVIFRSATATVEDGIYGGNHDYRATKSTSITISVPVKNQLGILQNIFGAGYGAGTVAGSTHVNLNVGAEVANVYGGGREGRVYNAYNHYDASEAFEGYSTNGKHATWQISDYDQNTLVVINGTSEGIAHVTGNVYGAGLGKENVQSGPNANTCGKTKVSLLGGIVDGDIYGGGYAGTMLSLDNTDYDENIGTLCAIQGGQVRNVFGGGFKGNTEGNTHVTIGILNDNRFSNGNPTIQRSAYGGGEMAKVTGTSTVDMWNGYVGYEYVDGDFRPLLDMAGNDKKLLKENGNLYGAGYGEGAVVMQTFVNLHGGVIRNGLYGGGEIAAVGVGATKLENEKYVLDTDATFVAGKTHVRMYGGLVEGDVFGGGRGFSYDLTGNQIVGTKFYTDGYVFGQTDVEIYRGTIGTDASLEEGHGNVFGGGNIGYVYGGTDAGRSIQYTGETDAANVKFNGHYYTNNTWATRTEDCHVHIEARCKVLEAVWIGGTRYEAGEYVPVEKLNTLSATADEWDYLDSEGITIRNAVFAGGNVSSGSDKIYANAVTIYGNATASVVDVFAKDFISVGGDGVGGLYGDGNLTFVDGYRELNITNYGTDFYNLDADLRYDEYLLLSDREKGFYNLLYSPKIEISFEFEGVHYIYHTKQGETAADEIDEHEFKTMLNAYIQDNASEMADLWDKTDDGVTVTYEPKQKIEFVLGGKTYIYSTGTSYSAAQYDEMMANYKLYIKQDMEAKWDINGECSLTAGRMLNTIQRADFCGMFGSRIMLYGAQDRVPEIVDYTKYTINRVGEVSLNQRKAAYNNTEIHGNYFGIYNVVNLLGALTSDVKFTDIREDVGILEEGLKADGTTKYIQYKYDKLSTDPRARNMASSKNMVAQASGVFLELVKEVDDDGNKTYGPVTGVIQLDLINVKPGEGGGYVYAKNEHHAPTTLASDITARQVLSRDNAGAVSYANFVYDGALQAMQTSGNFVHPTKRIVDECFPRGGYYTPGETNYSNAHFWYIRGDFYVYDQYVSGYTGAAQAYEQDIEIPLTIAAGSEGRMTLQSVNPSKYAYFVGKHYGDKVLTANDNILVEDKTYYLNDPISYWDWSQLSITDQAYFVDETYVAICDAMIIAGNNRLEYKKGHVLLPADYENLVTNSGNVAYIKDLNGNYQVDNDTYKEATDKVFRISNEISHDAGYLITFDITNPLEWDNYYTKLNKGDGNIEKMLESEYKAQLTAGTINAQDYTIAPTLLCTKSGIYGQREYALDDLVNEAVYNSQNGIAELLETEAYKAIKDAQAQFSRAYVVTADELSFTHAAKDYHMFVGSYISETLYSALDASLKNASNFEPAYICINTIEVADKEYVLNGQLIPASRYSQLKGLAQDNANTFMYGKADTNGELSRYFSPAYVCTEDGKYGGSYFEEKKNYRALDFCGLARDERNAKNQAGVNVFTYNFDAFDLLATDFNPDIREYQEPYWNTQAVNYTATYSGTGSYTLYMRNGASDTYDGSLKEAVTINNGTTYQRAEYEQILNEQSHYMPIKVDDVNVKHYIVNETFEKANIYYPVGKVISGEEYSKLSDLLKEKVTVFDANTFSVQNTTYYYCTEMYKMSQQSKEITNCVGDKKNYKDKGTTVPAGIVISQEHYNSLPNYQKGFIIQGHAPIQTTTIYVPRESDINNLSKDRVITVVYRYDYKEGEGTSITHHSEKHIINIHLEFRSGQPTIGDVTPPATVLPNSVVGLSVPSVKRGAYEILGGGWEIFETPEDAYEHKNGVDYKNNATPMYWYQNNYYVAYYAKTYLGKTYSNPVPFSVANYHRLGEVMNHEQRMYIDHKDVDRASKIYLDAAPYPTNSIAADFDENDPLISPDGKTDGKNDLDYLYDLYQETKNGQTLVVEPTKLYVFNPRIKNASNLEFILRSDIAPKKYADTSSEGWKQIGDSENCFAGTLHGNGYTISGLDKSLFNYLCGKVYNLGVTGSFTGGGVADHGGTNGYAENCWVYTTDNTPKTKAVIGEDGNIINSYYLGDNRFAAGEAIEETMTDFEQGEVAYQLNHFYLNKRYSDNTASITDNSYKYMYLNVANNTLSKQVGHYTDEHAIYEFAGTRRGYVEDYYADGDFIYANGEIPLTVNERLDQEDKMYYPIYPDDYIFFGQRLSYQDATHDDLPVRIKKQTVENKERIVRVGEANRVYRAPAYYKSKDKKEAYFNINAVFVDKYNGTFVDHDMTAIDFTGYKDGDYTDNQSGNVFYSPVLDFEGLSGISIDGLTPNLLVYADPKETQSYETLKDYLFEPELTYGAPNYIIGDYRSQAGDVRGHLVDLVDLADDGTYQATHDHYLVDKENFNAPITYQYAENYRMWYQRIPDRFADGSGKGWDIVCLPFTAEFVTTHQKGEITHFYGESKKMHEYWLRKLTDVTGSKATFARPTAGSTDYVTDYTATNRFLDEYYYSKYGQQDANSDSYQKYYNSDRGYLDYVHLTATIPYIIAFPGERYYEFDMSGTFVPQNTKNSIEKLDLQVVTMVSTPEMKIAVTDDEKRKATQNNYTFVGTYQEETVNGYLMNDEGGAFDVVTNETSVPFRGYLVKTSGTQAPPKRIFISGAAEEDEPMEEVTNRGLTIYGKKDAIYIESTLEYETTVIIYGLSGQVIARVKVQPMSKEVVTVPSRGVYIVNNRKVAVL